MLPVLVRTLARSASALGSHAAATATTSVPEMVKGASSALAMATVAGGIGGGGGGANSQQAKRVTPLSIGREMASEIVWVRSICYSRACVYYNTYCIRDVSSCWWW